MVYLSNYLDCSVVVLKYFNKKQRNLKEKNLIIFKTITKK